MNKIQHIPEGWEVKRLKDCLEIKHGKSQHNVEEADGIYPILASGGEIGRANKFIYDKPSVLIGRKGTIDKPKYFETPFWTVDTLFYTKIKPNNLPKFFFYKFQAINWKTYNEGSTIPSLSSSTIMSIKILLPPLLEQKRIAEVLGCWDEGIEELEKVISLKEQQKKWLMQRLLTGKTRLPGFNGAWREVKLGDVGKIVTGSTPPMIDKENYGGDFPWVTAQDFKKKYIYDSIIKLSTKGKSIARVVPTGSVLVTCIASIGLNAIAKADIATNQQINAIIPNELFSSEFLYYLLSNNAEYLKKFAGSGGILILSKEEFKKINFLIPNLIEQSAIAAVLSEADNEISQLKQKVNLFKQQKKWLMQQLLTGKKRLAC